MWLRTNTASKGKAKHIPLPKSLDELLAMEDLNFSFNARSIPAGHGFFTMNENNQIVQIRSEQDYARYWQLLKPTGERMPFLVYSKLSNLDSVEAILRLGPQPNPCALQSVR